MVVARYRLHVASLARREHRDLGRRLMGYGRPDYRDKWWYDLEDVNGDGILTAPRNVKSEFEER